MNFGNLLSGVKTLAVVCNQFGDTGKGKIVDLFADWADIIVRGNGGANAGHTICANGRRYAFHLIPSGILHDADGKVNIIGPGVALDPQQLCAELDELHRQKLPHKNLRISHRAKLLLPQHLVLDRVAESREGRIGTTGRGIGPCYTDHVSRTGLTANDLVNPDEFVRKLKRNVRDKVALLASCDPAVVKEVMHQPILRNGAFWQEEGFLNLDAITDAYLAYGTRLADMIWDTDELVQASVGQKNIVLEGAQGLLLSVDHGTYPFVTSSDSSVEGLARGAGLHCGAIDLKLGIVKAYMTRVGDGPFPTELGGEVSEQHCSNSSITESVEREQYPDVSVNDPDEFRLGVALRRIGREFGTTTGRPRRVGWLDLPMLRYAIRKNGPLLAMTRLDMFDECQTIKVCNHYTYDGPNHRVGGRSFTKGDQLWVAVPDPYVLRYCKPEYVSVSGWNTSISDTLTYQELPEACRAFMRTIEEKTTGTFRLISVGPDRSQTFLRPTEDDCT